MLDRVHTQVLLGQWPPADGKCIQAAAHLAPCTPAHRQILAQHTCSERLAPHQGPKHTHAHAHSHKRTRLLVERLVHLPGPAVCIQRQVRKLLIQGRLMAVCDAEGVALLGRRQDRAHLIQLHLTRCQPRLRCACFACVCVCMCAYLCMLSRPHRRRCVFRVCLGTQACARLFSFPHSAPGPAFAPSHTDQGPSTQLTSHPSLCASPPPAPASLACSQLKSHISPTTPTSTSSIACYTP